MTKKTISLVTERRRLERRAEAIQKYFCSGLYLSASEEHKAQTRAYAEAVSNSLNAVREHIAQFGNRMHVAGGSSGAGRYRPRSLLGGKARYVGEVA